MLGLLQFSRANLCHYLEWQGLDCLLGRKKHQPTHSNMPSSSAPTHVPPCLQRFADAARDVSPLPSPFHLVIYGSPLAPMHSVKHDVEVGGWTYRRTGGGAEGWRVLCRRKEEKAVQYLSFQRMPDMCLHFLPTFTINSFLSLRACVLSC